MRAAQSGGAEDPERSRDQPVNQRRFFQIRNAVQPRRDPVAGGQHVARDLRLHGVHIVHQRRRRNHAARIHGGGDEQDDQVEAKTLSIGLAASLPACRHSRLDSPSFHPEKQDHQSP